MQCRSCGVELGAGQDTCSDCYGNPFQIQKREIGVPLIALGYILIVLGVDALVDSSLINWGSSAGLLYVALVGRNLEV